MLESAGELLPLPYRDSLFYLVNVVECLDCLDEQRTNWILGETTGARIRIEHYHFDPSCLSTSTLFKIPQTAKAEVLTVTGVKDPSLEFKTIVERQGLMGLNFEKLWSV
jgi:hypothetical protein